jgi:beta-mannosidase
MKEGDSHYWGVWWGMEPFEMYEKKVPRFMSEFGFQSFPDISTIEKFTLPEDRYLNSDVMKSHQKHPVGYETIEEYMKRDFIVPADFQEYIKTSQLLQAYGIKKAIEAQRRAKPYCMGTLFWQLNDCWPGVTWSAIDYYGKWKELMYKIKDLYADVLVSPTVENDTLKVYVVSDKLEELQGILSMQLINSDSENTVWNKEIEITIPENSSKVYFSIPVNELLSGFDKSKVYFYCDVQNSKTMDWYPANTFLFVSPKENPGYYRNLMMK